MIPIIGLALFAKLSALLLVFLLLAIVLRGMSIYEKLALYSLILLAAVFALSKL